MKKIITISREFGSGGRELGKRIAENLGIAYYDNEIITAIAQKSGMAEEYIKSIVEKAPVTYFPNTIGRSFHSSINPQITLNAKIYGEQHNIIKELAKESDCVLIGRCSDYILRDYNPLRIFIYADMDARQQRCCQKALENEHLSDAQIKANIKQIDKNRAKYYNVFTGHKWGAKENYDLCINTSQTEIKSISLPISELLKNIRSSFNGL